MTDCFHIFSSINWASPNLFLRHIKKLTAQEQISCHVFTFKQAIIPTPVTFHFMNYIILYSILLSQKLGGGNYYSSLEALSSPTMPCSPLFPHPAGGGGFGGGFGAFGDFGDLGGGLRNFIHFCRGHREAFGQSLQKWVNGDGIGMYNQIKPDITSIKPYEPLWTCHFQVIEHGECNYKKQ